MLALMLSGALRRRFADLRRPHRRRTADPAVGGPRDHGDDAGVGGRADTPTSAPAVPAHRRGRRRRFRAAAGHDLGGAAHPPRGGRHHPDGARHESGWASGSFPRTMSLSPASRCRTHPRRTSPTPKSFNPDRFLGGNPDTHTWIPYGGGIRRCIGAAFANMEMNVTLRTLLREFEFGTTYAPGERIHSRGVATAPAHGGRAVVYRRGGSTSTIATADQRQRVPA